ncbi:MAG: DUF1501 domain-containing protein [Myxococcales bacterium]|nr:DUF1501 domain-containing protein [Myxococcales bacterium]
MDRRKFLSLATMAGLGVVSPLAFGRSRGGLILPQKPTELDAYTGPLVVMIHAGGGWDVTSLCDPKGSQGENDPDPMNQSYLAGEIGKAGNIRYAPLGNDDNPNAFRDFFEKHSERLLVINGIDMKTNGHDGGTRHISSGRLSEGYPAFAALHSAIKGQELPMSFLSFGGYDETNGLVARTRSGNTNALARIAYPDRSNPDDENSTFHSPVAADLISKAQEERYNKLLSTEALPRTQQALNLLWAGRAGANELKKLAQYLPDPLSQNGFERQVQVTIAAYKAGIATSAQLTRGGFDTHGNNDAGQIAALMDLLNGINFLYDWATSEGVWGNVIVLVGSDFGRTPGYNDGNGKDHWPISSVMMMGKGIQGNRVIGGTDERHGVLSVNPQTLQLDPNGIHIEPHHIHHNLRLLTGVEEHDLARMFPISIPDDEQMKLFV